MKILDDKFYKPKMQLLENKNYKKKKNVPSSLGEKLY